MPGVLVAVALGSACAAKAAPLVPSDVPVLAAPEPPLRVVVPAPEQPTLPPVEEPPPAATPPARASETPPVTRTAPPTRPVNEPPVPTSTAPPPILRTTANTAEFEKRVRAQLTRAQADLSQVRRSALGADARAQYDSAMGFVRQAEDALKVKNLVYAGQLADKAATMAALLRKQSPRSPRP